MRIALVSPYDPNPVTADGRAGHVGGVERVFQHVARTLAERGHDVTLLCTSDGRCGSSRENEITVVRQRRRGTIMRAPVASLASDVPSDVDVVHVPATYPFTTPGVLRRAAREKLPCVLDFHFEPDPGHAIGRLAARAYSWTTPKVYNQADAVVVRSLSYGRSARSLHAVPEARWRVVPNGIDPQTFHPNGNGHKPADEGYLLFVGRLVPYKGLHVLLDALARLDDPPPLLIAGDGPLRPRLEAQAKRLGVDARFLGRVEDEALPDLYRNARLTVLPSVNGQEAFGITLLESMACGTPVVASCLPGVAEVALEGGRVSRPGDTASLARQLHNALDPDELQRGHALASRIHRNYSWDAVTDRLVGVYEETLGEREQGERLLTLSRA